MCWRSCADRSTWQNSLCNDDNWENYLGVWKCGYLDSCSVIPKVCGSTHKRGLVRLTETNSEIAPARRRGGVVVMNHIGMVSGLAVAFW